MGERDLAKIRRHFYSRREFWDIRYGIANTDKSYTNDCWNIWMDGIMDDKGDNCVLQIPG